MLNRSIFFLNHEKEIRKLVSLRPHKKEIIWSHFLALLNLGRGGGSSEPLEALLDLPLYSPSKQVNLRPN